MKLDPKVLYRPSQPNFPLIDFFAVIGNKLTFFQMTVSDSKPSPLDILSKAKLRPLIELYSKTFTADGRLIEVVFVVPDIILNSFRLTKTGWLKEDAVKRMEKKEHHPNEEEVKERPMLMEEVVAFSHFDPGTRLQLVASVDRKSTRLNSSH